jgi:hypothetical protein
VRGHLLTGLPGVLLAVMVALVLAEAIPAPVQIDWLPAFFMAGSRILYDDDALGLVRCRPLREALANVSFMGQVAQSWRRSYSPLPRRHFRTSGFLIPSVE